MTFSQGRQQIVGYGGYCIVDDSLTHNSQETILMVGIVGSVVKIVMQKFKIDDTLHQCFDAIVSFIFIELFDSSMGEDLTTPPSLMNSLKGIFKFGDSLLLEPSTRVGRIQSVAFCLHSMVLPR
jgi:hypothetical protein